MLVFESYPRGSWRRPPVSLLVEVSRVADTPVGSSTRPKSPRPKPQIALRPRRQHDRGKGWDQAGIARRLAHRCEAAGSALDMLGRTEWLKSRRNPPAPIWRWEFPRANCRTEPSWPAMSDR